VIRLFSGASAAIEALAESIVRSGERALAARGEFRIGVSGGGTPVPLYLLLASATWAGRLDWSRARVLFADERAVPPDHPDSNFRLVREKLIDPLRIPEPNVYRMRGEADDLDAAAREYESHLVRPIDLLLLGVGDDGHTASIFPGSAGVHERTRRAIAVHGAPKPPPERLTVTPRALGEAREVSLLVLGEEKAPAVAGAIEGEVAPERLPARLLRERDWYLDAGAASSLRRRAAT
jgi:6-phosphogluconolactonase